MKEYECHQCKSKFYESEGIEAKNTVKCPSCGGTDVKEVNAYCSVSDFFRNIMASGGG